MRIREARRDADGQRRTNVQVDCLQPPIKAFDLRIQKDIVAERR